MTSAEKNKDPLNDFVRSKIHQHNKNAQANAPTNQDALYIQKTAVPVKYFWECPQELLFSKQLYHMTGNIKNSEVLLTNLDMTGILCAVCYANGVSKQFTLFQVVVSLADYFVGKQEEGHLFSTK